MKIKIAAICIALGWSFGCGDDDDDKQAGQAIGAPQIEPPVVNNLPDAMRAVALRFRLVTDGEVDINESARDSIKEYMNPNTEFVNPAKRLKAIDERMAELDSRAQESQKKCLEADAETYTLPGNFPAGATLAVKFQCRDDLDGGTAAQLAFGTDDDNFYLYERNSNVITVSVAPKDGDSVEVWQGGIDTEGRSGWTHIKGSLSDGVVEFSTAGELGERMAPTTCGVRVKANESLVYATGRYSVGSECSEVITFCLDAAGEDVDVSQCTDANMDDFTVADLQPDSQDMTTANAELFTETVIDDVAAFNEDVESEEE